MKDFRSFVLKCGCSKRMKRGKHIKIYRECIRKCPNCRKEHNICLKKYV